MRTWYALTKAIKHLPTARLKTLTTRQTHERRTWYIANAFKNVTTERMFNTWPALHVRYEFWISHALLKQRDRAEYPVLLFDQTRVFQ